MINGVLDKREQVSVKQPPGFESYGINGLPVLEALYRLKQMFPVFSTIGKRLEALGSISFGFRLMRRSKKGKVNSSMMMLNLDDLPITRSWKGVVNERRF